MITFLILLPFLILIFLRRLELRLRTKEDEIIKLWQGLGYYSRARNLHKTAIFISNNLQGNFPDNYQDLIQLKGVGDYTASAIASICFNENTATVDGNVYRFLSRFFGISTPINSTKGIKEFKALAQSLMDKENPGNHNQAMMEFGAIICKPHNPDCNNCPFKNNCSALLNNNIKVLPIKENKVKIKKRYFNFLIINSENENTMISKRTKNDIWRNLYEFPLLESKTQIDHKELIESPTLEKLMLQKSYHISKFNQEQIVHKLTHQHLYTTFWIIDTNELMENSISWRKLSNFALPTLLQNFVDEYQKRD